MALPSPPRNELFVYVKEPFKVGSVIRAGTDNALIASRGHTKIILEGKIVEDKSCYVHLLKPVPRYRITRFFFKWFYRIRHYFIPGYIIKDRIFVEDYQTEATYGYYYEPSNNQPQ